jgi:hypothetical protein
MKHGFSLLAQIFAVLFVSLAEPACIPDEPENKRFSACASGDLPAGSQGPRRIRLELR